MRRAVVLAGVLRQVHAGPARFERHLFGRSYEMEKPPEAAPKAAKGGS